MDDYKYNPYNDYVYGDEEYSDYTYEMGDPGGGGGDGPGNGETQPGGNYAPPTQEEIPVGPPASPPSESQSGSGTSGTTDTVIDDGTTPADNDGYEGEIRTVMSANGPIMYRKTNGSWVVYYGTSNFAPDGSNINEVIAAALASMGMDVLESSGGDVLDSSGTLPDPLVVTGLTVNGVLTAAGTETGIDHGTLGGKSDDDHTQYAILTGRAGSEQNLRGGVAPGGHLYLESTTDNSKGIVKIQNNSGGVLIGTDTTLAGGLHVASQVGNVSLHMSRDGNDGDHGQIHTGSNGEMVIRATSNSAVPSLTLQTFLNDGTASGAKAGDIVFDNTGGDVRPNDTTPRVNLGVLAKKFKEIHAETLRVETLVSDNVIATIGGRIIVTPSSTLGEGLISEASSTVKLMHNSLGDHYIVLKSGGNAEYIRLGSQSGTSTHSDGIRTMYHYPSSTRNKNGLGSVPTWDAGTSVASYAGSAAGDGMMELYSQSALLLPGSSSGTAPVGPTILGLKRTSATDYYDTVESFAVGNLNNLFGESGADQYGIAAGNYTATGTWMRASNLGFAVKYNSTSTVNKFEVDGNGNTTIGSGTNYIFLASSSNHDMIGTDLVDAGDIVLYGGSANKYIWLDSDAAKVTLRASASNYLELSGTSVKLVSSSASIDLDGVGGQITASGIISGASLQTGASGPRVVISDNSIANSASIGGLCSFIEISPHGSGGALGGNDTDLIHVGIYQNGGGSIMRLGGNTVAAGKFRGRIWHSANQYTSVTTGDNNVNSNVAYTRWQTEVYDGANSILYQQIVTQASPKGIFTSINKASVDNFYIGNEMTTPHFAVDATDDEYGSAIDRSYIATGGYLKVGQSIQGNSGKLLIIPASDNDANLYTAELNSVLSSYGDDSESSVITGVASHHWNNNVTNIISDRATIFTSRACSRESTGVTTTAGGKNVFGYASGCRTNAGRHSIHRLNGNVSGWAVGVLSKQTENSRAMLLYIFISDSTVTWSFLDSGSNHNAASSGDGFCSETVTMTAVPSTYLNASKLRVAWSNTGDPQKLVYWHQICGSVGMVCSYDA